MRLVSLLLLGFSLALSPAGAVLAQAFPSKPVHIVVGYPPGGATDIIARLLAAKLQERLQQPVVVENRAGANGNIGADYVAKATPDGYTLGFGGGGPLTANAYLYKNLPYDAAKDFAMVAAVGRAPLVLAASPSLGVKNLKELVALLKKEPGRYAFGSPGYGSPQHLATALFMSLTDTKVTHVPYKGAAPMLNDMVAGQVHFGFDNLGMMPFVKSGRLLALGTAQEQRSALYPDVPTFSEAGVPGLVAFTWYGVFTAAGTPATVVDKLNGEFRAVLELPDVKQRLADLAIEPMQGSPKEMQTFVAAEREKWGRLVRELKMGLN